MPEDTDKARPFTLYLPFPKLCTRANYIKRFEAKVQKGDTPDDCWRWLGARRNKEGYGGFWYEGAMEYAHRVACVLYKKRWRRGIPEGLVVLHKKCNFPPCVNPRHLKVSTQKENMFDRHSGQKTFGSYPKYLKAVA